MTTKAEIKEVIKSDIRERFGETEGFEIKGDSFIFELGFDSLDMIELIMTVEVALDMNIEDQEFDFDKLTINELAELINKQINE
jgi:acyl carrier protein